MNFPTANPTDWILAHRPARLAVDPFQPHGYFVEQERDATGALVDSGVILLTNKECPWHCLMCDLWRHTLTETVPPGAIPRQIEYAFAHFNRRPLQVKLYNSGSFFDPAAIPLADYPGIARLLTDVRHVIVESHPRLIGEKALRLRDALEGSLEVALGLETVHPEILPRLNKRFDLGHFRRASEFLRTARIGLRAFVLVKPPFMGESEAVDWAVRSAEFAYACGATVVSLIPTRLGNGALEALQAADDFAPPHLSTLERALEAVLALGAGRVFADTWNLNLFSRCSLCAPARAARLEQMNRTQEIIERVECRSCGKH